MDIAAAGLNLRDNGKNVSFDSYVLTCIVLSLCILSIIVVMYKHKTIKLNRSSFIIPISLMISFCAANISYYTMNKPVDKPFYDFSIAYLVLICLPLVSFILGIIFQVGYMFLIYMKLK